MQKSLKLLRERGYPVIERVERWNPWGKVRQDLFGFGDILCVRPPLKITFVPNGATDKLSPVDDGEMLMVQTTSYSNHTKRVAKIRDMPSAHVWLKAGGKIEVHGWRKGHRRLGQEPVKIVKVTL